MSQDKKIDINLSNKSEVYFDNLPVVDIANNNTLNLQPYQQSISIESHNPSKKSLDYDYKVYSTLYNDEMELIVSMDDKMKAGKHFIDWLYTYRSVSQAIPEISMNGDQRRHSLQSNKDYDEEDISMSNNPINNGDDELTPEEKMELQQKKQEINNKIIDIFRPEIYKFKELISFIQQATNLFSTCIQKACYKYQHDQAISQGFLETIISFFVILMKIDLVKDYKTSLLKDFSRYKRVMKQSLTQDLDMIEEMQLLESFFLSPQDPKKIRNYIFYTFKNDIQRITDHKNILAMLINLAFVQLNDIHYVVPEEKYRYLLALVGLIVLSDGDSKEDSASNIFRNHRNIDSFNNIQKVIQKNPIIPLYGDMTVTMERILELAVHYDRKSMGNAWGVEPDNEVIRSYQLATYWESIRQSYQEYIVKFTASVNRYEHYSFEKTVDEFMIESSRHIYKLIKEGMMKLSRWNMLVQMMLTWKFTHPSTSTTPLYNTNNDNSPEEEQINPEDILREGIEYAKVFKYNLTAAELNVLIDILSMIKSLSSQLTKYETLFAPFLRFHIYHHIQSVLQDNCIPLLHRLDKYDAEELEKLLSVRSIAVHWQSLEVKEQNILKIKEYSSKTAKKTGASTKEHDLTKFLPLICVPNLSQMFLLRNELTQWMSEFVKKQPKSILKTSSKNELKKADKEILEEFLEESFFFSYVYDYVSVIQHSCLQFTMNMFWLREYYLDMTKCVQFPIDMSLPWVMIEYVLSTIKSSTASANILTSMTSTSGSSHQTLQTSEHMTSMLLNKIGYLLDLYNDLSNYALFVVNKQYLYDEIEAEMNLAIDQFYYLLTEEIYLYFKSHISHQILDQSMILKLAEIYPRSLSTGGSSNPSSAKYVFVVPSDRHVFLDLLQQKTIGLLGRSINLSYIFTQAITNKLYGDLNILLKRFETTNISHLMELNVGLSLLHSLHKQFSIYLELDPFEQMLYEVDESISLTSYRGRVSLHILNAMANDLVCNYSYNSYTHRYVLSPILIKPMPYTTSSMTASAVSNKSSQLALWTQFFGNTYEPSKTLAADGVTGNPTQGNSLFTYYKAFDLQFKLTRQFFGSVHLQLIYDLHLQYPQLINLTMIIDQLVKNLFDKILDINEYLEALKTGIPPIKPPQSTFQTIGAYGYYESKLKALLEYDDLKPEVFQNFREVGNTIVLLSELSKIIETNQMYQTRLLSSLFLLHPMKTLTSSLGSMISSQTVLTSSLHPTTSHSSAIRAPSKAPGNIRLSMMTEASKRDSMAKDSSRPASLPEDFSFLATDDITASFLSSTIEKYSFISLLRNFTNELTSHYQPPNKEKGDKEGNDGLETKNNVCRNIDTVQRLLPIIQRQLETYCQSAMTITKTSGPEKPPVTIPLSSGSPLKVEVQSVQQKNLMHWVLAQLEEFLYQQNLTMDWSIFTPEVMRSIPSPTFAFDVESAVGFFKIFAALNFLFCINDMEDGKLRTAPAAPFGSVLNGLSVEESEESISNLSEFGHGFIIAGSLFLHLLGQRPHHQTINHIQHVLNLADYEERVQAEQSPLFSSMIGNQSANPTSGVTVDPSLVAETKLFLYFARLQNRLTQDWLSFFEHQYKPRVSYNKYAVNTTKFKPSKDSLLLTKDNLILKK